MQRCSLRHSSTRIQALLRLVSLSSGRATLTSRSVSIALSEVSVKCLFQGHYGAMPSMGIAPEASCYCSW